MTAIAEVFKEIIEEQTVLVETILEESTFCNDACGEKDVFWHILRYYLRHPVMF
jgi:hypothetical protein